MKLLKTLLATALVAASLLPAAHAQERTIKFAFQNQKDHPQAQGAQKFADLVAAKTNGRIAVSSSPAARWAATCRPCRRCKVARWR